MTIASNLSQIETAGLVQLARVVPEVEYIFRHVLTQEAAYESLLKQDRRRLHVSVGEVLEHAHRGDIDEFAAILVHHFWNGGQWQKTYRYAMHAAGVALMRNGMREAMGHYDRAFQALEQIPGAPLENEYDAIMGWAQAAFRYRPYAEQLDRLQKAQEIAQTLHDTRRLAQALYTIGNVHRASGHNLRATQPLAECFTIAEQLGDEKLTVIPTYYMGMLVMNSDSQRALELFTRTITLARRFGMPDMEAYALGSRAMVLARLGEAAQAKQDLQEAFRLIDHENSLMVRSDIDLFAGWSFLDLGDARQSLEYGHRGIDEALSADNTDCVCYGFVCVGFGHLQAQQLPEATAAFEESIQRSRFSGARLIENMGQSGLAMTRFSDGHPDALAEMEQALKEAEQIDNQLTMAALRQLLSEVYAQSGNPTQALDYLNLAADYYRRTHMRPRLLRALQSMADLYESLGQQDAASKLRTEIALASQALGNSQPSLGESA